MKYFINKLKLFLSLFIYINLLILVPVTLSSTCPTGLPALSLKDCTGITNTTNYCCLLKMSDGTPKMCYEFEISKFTGQSTVDYGINTYILDCGIKYIPSNLSNTTIKENNTDLSILNNSTYTNSNNSNPISHYTGSTYYGVGGSNCGRSSPINQTDCNIQSTKMHSCCFYNVMGVNGCYWIDRKFNGKYQTDTFDLFCEDSSNRISISFSILKIIFLILIF